MYTEINCKEGLVKSSWSEVRSAVQIAEPNFTNIVDTLSPDSRFPVYLAYIPYGCLKGDTESPHIPIIGGGYYRLNSPDTPADITKHLGYGKNSSPMGMVLSKCLEYYIDMKESQYTIPWGIAKPGDFFPYQRMLSIQPNRVYSPNGILKGAAGARSVFMLPNIGCNTHHQKLKRELDIKSSAPKKLYEQWNVFKEISNSTINKSDWKCCILYFSEIWLEHLRSDPSWLTLKNYLLTKGWLSNEFAMSSEYYDYMFSMAARKRNLRPNPYLIDTAKHIFKSALGVVPGYSPLVDDECLPLNLLQQAYVESYGLKHYNTTIIGPSIFEYEKEPQPIYYSLQYPSTQSFSPKAKHCTTTLQDLDELKDALHLFQEEFSNQHSICSDTILNEIAKFTKFNYYHNTREARGMIKNPAGILSEDNRFLYAYNKSNTDFSVDSKFFRGCISIQKSSVSLTNTKKQSVSKKFKQLEPSELVD